MHLLHRLLPTRKGYIECSFKQIGKVTTALRQVTLGDTVGFRGPYGNFPLEKMVERPPGFHRRGDRPGSRTLRHLERPGLARPLPGCVDHLWRAQRQRLVYKNELDVWAKRPDVKLYKTVDPGETWLGQEHRLRPDHRGKGRPKAENSYAIVCGPPIMIKYTIPVLTKLGFPEDRIPTTLENRMKCGLSDRIGYVGQSVTRSLTINGLLANRSKSISDQRRALLLPQELMQFPTDRLLLLRGGIPPIIGTKIFYYKSRFFKNRAFPAPVVSALEKTNSRGTCSTRSAT